MPLQVSFFEVIGRLSVHTNMAHTNRQIQSRPSQNRRIPRRATVYAAFEATAVNAFYIDGRIDDYSSLLSCTTSQNNVGRYQGWLRFYYAFEFITCENEPTANINHKAKHELAHLQHLSVRRKSRKALPHFPLSRCAPPLLSQVFACAVKAAISTTLPIHRYTP